MSALSEHVPPETGGECAEQNWKSWTAEKFMEILEGSGVSQTVVKKFANSNIQICGEDLEHLKFDGLLQMGLSWQECHEVKRKVLEVRNVWKQGIMEYKIFNDPIHGSIRVHPACIAIIDTPQFQRLRHLKQLGLCYYVYPGGAHNRFEHSIGVCHLAGMFVRSLRDSQSYLDITDVDVLCVEIAALCHDLGHGPFSHLFDGKVIPAVNPGSSWKHEKASQDMFDHLIRENHLMADDGKLTKYGLTLQDIVFIKELIDGPPPFDSGNWNCVGRPKEKSYLYEIVSNKRNGIDVDKWDYLARDSYHLGISNNFDHQRYIKFARVIEVDGQLQICIRDKEVMNLYNMFSTRYTLHKTAYQHKVCSAIEAMISDALARANDHVLITGRDGRKFKISECMDDMVAYTKLTDNVLFNILESDSNIPALIEARKIIQRIFCRDLYTCVEESKPIDPQKLGQQDARCLEREILKKAGTVNDESQASLTADDFFVQVVRLDFGMKEENPVEKLNSYTKLDPDQARHLSKEDVSRILAPYNFKELLLRVYSRSRNQDRCDLISAAYKKWFVEKFGQTDVD